MKTLVVLLLLLPALAFGQGYFDGYTEGYGVATAAADGPWNGYDYVMVITADDGYSTNLDRGFLADSLGFVMTLCMSGSNITDTDPDFLYSTDMATIATYPIEVISTGLFQNSVTAPDPSWGILKWDVTSLDTDELPTDSGAYPDSVDIDNDPQFIEDWCGIDFAPQNFITDIGPMSYDVAVRHRVRGYKSCRAIYHDNPAGGVRFDAPGADRWDKVRLFGPEVGGNIYGLASFRGEHTSDQTQAIFGTLAEPNQTTIDSLDVRMDRLLYDVSDASDSAPIMIVMHSDSVTKNMLSELMQRVIARGDTWIVTQNTLADYIRAEYVPIAAPPYAPYAQLEGFTAADSIFWGPEPLALTATDSFIFHNSNSAAPIAGEIVSVTTGPFTTGLLNQAVPSTAVDPTANIAGSFTTLVIDAAGVTGFGVSALAGKDIVSARIHYYQVLGQDLTADTDFFGVIGVTNPAILAASGSNDISYNFLNVTGSTPWDLPGGTIAGLDFLTDIGPFIYADTDHAAIGFRSKDCTEYLREVAPDGVAMFIFGGYRASSNALYRTRGHEYTTDTNRPYLIVTTRDQE